MKRAIRFVATAVCLFAGMLAGAPVATAQTMTTLPLVLPVTEGGTREGFVRIINNSPRAGTVRIHAIDDAGERFGPITIDIGANAAVHFRSRDLEQGNTERGLSAGLGNGVGNWRLDLDSGGLRIRALAYVRTSDGFLTSIHDTSPQQAGTGHLGTYHQIVFFNPGSNVSKQSRLRLTNPGENATAITISARDDTGACAPDGNVRLTLPVGASRTLTAQALENGGDGFTGSFGDGTGKWRLSSIRPCQSKL